MQDSPKKAVVLLSGGLDSSTALAVARSEGYELFALSFDYRQRHGIELEAARRVASSVKVSRHLTVNFDLREIGGSALTSDIPVPRRSGKEKGDASISVPVTYVPARNTIFLSFGLAWAEVLAAGTIFIGANQIDFSGYPDCRPDYLSAFERMANLATKASVEGKMRFEVRAPLINMTKAEIIRLGLSLGLDYALTWSCYDPQPAAAAEKAPCAAFGYLPCGSCDSCMIRDRGFREAGIPDPLFFSGTKESRSLI